MAVTKTIILYSGTSFRVPNTWNSLNNSVICIGAGGGGRTAGNISGGGGGAYASNVNITLTPNSTISIIIGAGGAANANGGFTSINSGTVNAAGGKSNTSGGGAGGSTSDSTGTTTFAGGRGGLGTQAGANPGGGGGGGAGGNTATGNTGNAATGAADIPFRGGDAGRTGGSRFNGWDRGDSIITFGNGYGGGGGEGGYTESGKGGWYVSGSPGYLFGGGGGGGSFVGGPTYGAAGGQGGIILSWTYNSKLPDATVAMTMDAVTIALDRTPSSQITLNEGDVRDLFGAPTGASLISFSGGASKVANGAIVATSNTTGSVSSNVSLPSGWQNGDLAVLFIANLVADNTAPTISTAGWTFLGANSRAKKTSATTANTCAFSRVLQTGDLAPTFTQTGGGAFMIAIRNASLATALQANNYQTGANVTFSGFTKNADSKKLITFIADLGNEGGTLPIGWTEHLPRVNLTNFCIQCATVNSASYTNGSNVVWTGFKTAGFGQMGILLEVS